MKMWNYAVENPPRDDYFVVLFPNLQWDKAKFKYENLEPDGGCAPYEGNWYLDNGELVHPIAYMDPQISSEDINNIFEATKHIIDGTEYV
jgi:hypothetical protein